MEHGARVQTGEIRLMGKDNGRDSSYSSPLFLPIQEGSELPFLLAMPYELFDERFVIERPFYILRLARVVNKNVA